MPRPPAQASNRSAITRAPAALKRLQQISRVLDNAVPIPGTKTRIGLDPILGLFPGGGDVFTGLLSVYIVFEGARMGVPAATLARMGGNILIDVLTGTVPVLGDIFDVAWKANSQNVALLEKHMTHPEPSRAADRLWAIVVIVALLVLVIGMASLSVWLVTQAVALLR